MFLTILLLHHHYDFLLLHHYHVGLPPSLEKHGSKGRSRGGGPTIPTMLPFDLMMREMVFHIQQQKYNKEKEAEKTQNKKKEKTAGAIATASTNNNPLIESRDLHCYSPVSCLSRTPALVRYIHHSSILIRYIHQSYTLFFLIHPLTPSNCHLNNPLIPIPTHLLDPSNPIPFPLTLPCSLNPPPPPHTHTQLGFKISDQRQKISSMQTCKSIGGSLQNRVFHAVRAYFVAFTSR